MYREGRTIKKHSIFKAFFTVTGFSVFTRLLAFAFKVYLSRELGAEVMGIYQICISVFMLLLCLSATGIPLTVSRKTAEIGAENKASSDERALITSALVIGLLIASAVLIVFYACHDYLYLIFADERCIPIFLIMLPALISSTVYGVLRGWFWGRKQFSIFSATELVEELLRILFTIFFACGFVSSISGEMGIAIAFTIADFVCAIILVVMFFVKGGRLSRPKGFISIFRSSAPITGMRLFGSITNSATALLLPVQLVASGLSVSQATALFGEASGMALPLIFAPSAITSALAVVLIPEIASASVKNEKGKLNRCTSSSIAFSIIVTGLFFSLYMPMGEEYGIFLYGDAFAGKFVQIASAVMIPMGISSISSSMLNSLGLESKAFLSYSLGTVCLILSILFLPKVIGIYSLAVGMFICHTIIAFTNIRILKKKTGVNVSVLRPTILTVIFTAFCTFIGAFTFSLLLHIMPRTVAMIFSSALIIVCYFTLCIIFKLIDISTIIKKRPKHKQKQA